MRALRIRRWQRAVLWDRILICDIYTDSDTGIATDAGAAAGPATDTAVARVDGLRWHVRHAAVAEQPEKLTQLRTQVSGVSVHGSVPFLPSPS